METTPSSARFKSLDIFRGLCIAAMIVVNNPGPSDQVYRPLAHAQWDGWTFADTIFPAFLWIVGVAITLSTLRRIARGDDKWPLLKHALKRAALLFLLGLFVEGFPRYDLAHLQLTGVLQKIAVAYLLAFTIFLWTTWRGQLAALLAIFAAYLGLMLFLPVPGCDAGGPWTMDCNAARYLDSLALAGHTWVTPSHNDPDGLLSVLSSTSSVLFGILAGRRIFGYLEPDRRTGSLLVWGLGLTCAGALLSLLIPISKILWTPSYSTMMAGFASTAFGVCYWIVEERQLGAWLKPFEVFGVNSIAAYVVSRLGANPLKVHVMGRSLSDVLRAVATPVNASLLFALVNVLMVLVIMSWMFHRRIFLKL
jgi:predicted acyltransferase